MSVRMRDTNTIAPIDLTRVASHVAHSDTPSITCLVARLSRSETPTFVMTPLRPMARLHARRSGAPVAGLAREVSWHAS